MNDFKFKYSLIYSDKINEIAIVKHWMFDMVHIENEERTMDDLSSRIYFKKGIKWFLIDEWYE